MDILLNDASSPIVSTVRASSKYATQKLPETFDGYQATFKNGIMKEAVDLNVIINDFRSLGKTEDHLKDVDAALNRVD